MVVKDDTVYTRSANFTILVRNLWENGATTEAGESPQGIYKIRRD